MTIAQIEHADTFTDPLPERGTVARMIQACARHDAALTLAFRKHYSLGVARKYSEAPRVAQLTNELTQAELHVRETLNEMINVARLLVAEADNSEAVTE